MLVQGRIIQSQPKQREQEGVGAEGGFRSPLIMMALCNGVQDPPCASSLGLSVRITPE